MRRHPNQRGKPQIAMNKEIIAGKYGFCRFYPVAFLQEVIFVLLAVFFFNERNMIAILSVLFIALILYPIMVSAIFPLVISFKVLHNGIETGFIGFDRFIEWEEIKSARSRLGYVHISFSRCGTLQVPSPYFMANRNEVYKAIDEYAPKDSPIRRILF